MKLKNELITPERAEQLLKLNVRNRDVRPNHVSFLSRQMINGTWRENNGDTIRISKSDVLLDGQHRLLAVIESGISFNFLIAYDIDDDIMPTIDTGAIRRVQDVFKIEDIKNSTNISSGIRSFLYLTKSDKLETGEKLSNEEILEEYYKRPDFYQEVHNKATSWYFGLNKAVPVTFIFANYCFIHDNNPKNIDDNFDDNFDMIFGGMNIQLRIIHLFRNQVINSKISKYKRMSRLYMQAIFNKTYNAIVKDKDLKVLKFTDDEKFPNIKFDAK